MGDHRYGRMASARWLAVTAAVTLIALAGCTFPHLVTFPFRRSPNPSVTAPPAGGLLLWLEGDTSLVLDGAGRVARWNDVRGPGRAVVPLFGFSGTSVTTTFATPSGPRRRVGLRCAAEPVRCAYAGDLRIRPPPFNLTGTPYSILAVVVRRPGPRLNNYFLMSFGSGCQVRFGGTGCTANTVLHLGWLWDSTIRHSHYDFDVNSFVLRPSEEPTLIVAQSGPRGGMDVASLGAAYCSFRLQQPSRSRAAERRGQQPTADRRHALFRWRPGCAGLVLHRRYLCAPDLQPRALAHRARTGFGLSSQQIRAALSLPQRSGFGVRRMRRIIASCYGSSDA